MLPSLICLESASKIAGVVAFASLDASQDICSSGCLGRKTVVGDDLGLLLSRLVRRPILSSGYNVG